MHPYLHCCTIHVDQDTKTTKVSHNRCLNKVDVLHFYNRILLSHKKRGKYSLFCSWGPEAKANYHLDLAVGNNPPPHALGGSCCLLGARGGEKLANSALGDWDMALNLKGNISRASRLWNAPSWHLCNILMSIFWVGPLWVLHCNCK